MTKQLLEDFYRAALNQVDLVFVRIDRSRVFFKRPLPYWREFSVPVEGFTVFEALLVTAGRPERITETR